MHKTMAQIPLEISGYFVLPLTLPPQRSFSTPATHYLYLRPHEPKIPTEDTPRSLFLVNVPIDATELHMRHLFGTQLGGGRVERVDFEGARSKSKPAVASPVQTRKGKKRKRAEIQSMDEVEGADLPEVWDRELHRSGGTAVVVFVDRTSMEASLKAAKKAAKGGKEIVWGQGVEEKLPRLGSEREYSVGVRFRRGETERVNL